MWFPPRRRFTFYFQIFGAPWDRCVSSCRSRHFYSTVWPWLKDACDMSEQKVPWEPFCGPASPKPEKSAFDNHCSPENEGPQDGQFCSKRTSKMHTTWADEWEMRAAPECLLWGQRWPTIVASIGLWFRGWGGDHWNLVLVMFISTLGALGFKIPFNTPFWTATYGQRWHEFRNSVAVLVRHVMS